MKIFLMTGLMALLMAGCLKLDSFLFTPEPVERYAFEGYEGDAEIKDEVAFIKVASNLIHQFSLPSANGHEIYAVFIGDTAEISNQNIILYCHGRADHMDNYWPRAKLLWHLLQETDKSGSVLMFDYQGYGLSEGAPTEEALYEDTYAMYQWLQTNGMPDSLLTIYGYSLGTAPATRLAAALSGNDPGGKKSSAKLILESPFASADVFAQDATQLAMPGSFVVDLSINNAEVIREVNLPFLWMHGTADDFIPINTHGEVVFNNYGGGSAAAIRVKGGHHSDLPPAYGVQAYILAIGSYLE